MKPEFRNVNNIVDLKVLRQSQLKSIWTSTGNDFKRTNKAWGKFSRAGTWQMKVISLHIYKGTYANRMFHTPSVSLNNHLLLRF